MGKGALGFERVENGMFKCETCGAEVPAGIINLANHWNDCAGKGQVEALMKLREQKGSALTLEDIDKAIKE